jgi:hypothetical protein
MQSNGSSPDVKLLRIDGTEAALRLPAEFGTSPPKLHNVKGPTSSMSLNDSFGSPNRYNMGGFTQ